MESMMYTKCLRCGDPAIKIPWAYAQAVGYTRYSYCENCLRAGIKALEGRTEAKKPLQVWYCPKCEDEISAGQEKCFNCGQLLDWT